MPDLPVLSFRHEYLLLNQTGLVVVSVVESADHDSLDADPRPFIRVVHEDDHSAVPPLQHAAAGQIPVTTADPQLFPARRDDPFVGLRRIIAQVRRPVHGDYSRMHVLPQLSAFSVRAL